MSITPSIQSGPHTLREESQEQSSLAGRPERPGLELRRRIGANQRSEGKFTFEGNSDNNAAKIAEKSSTVASSSYQYFLINESSRHDAETANFEKRNIPKEFSAAVSRKQDYLPDYQVPVMEKEVEPPRARGGDTSAKPTRNESKEVVSRSRERRPDYRPHQLRAVEDPRSSEDQNRYSKRLMERPLRGETEPSNPQYHTAADRSTSRVRAAHYVPLERPRKDSGGELFSPLGEQECHDFIKLNTSPEKNKRRESVLDRIEKEILRREVKKPTDHHDRGDHRPRDGRNLIRTDQEYNPRERNYRDGSHNPEPWNIQEPRNRSRSAHRERGVNVPSAEQGEYRPVNPSERGQPLEERRSSTRVRTKYKPYEGKEAPSLSPNEHQANSHREEPQTKKTPGSGSKKLKREVSPQHTKTEQVMSTDFIRHGMKKDSSGNLLATMSPVHSSVRNSLKSKKHE